MNTIHLRPIVAIALALAGWATDANAQTSSSTVGRNVYAAGSTVRPSSPVEGDFVAAGGHVTIDQAVKGDVLAAGGSVDVRAPVGDDVRAAGGDVSIESKIGGELVAAGGNVTLTSSSQVEQGALLAGGNLTLDGKIAGGLKARAKNIVINGEVTGDARLVAEQIVLGPSAKISGALHYAARELKKGDGAVVGGDIVRDERDVAGRRHDGDWQERTRRGAPSWVGSIFAFLGLLGAGAVFLLLFPRFSLQAPGLISRSPWLSLAIGFGMLVGVPILAVLLLITLLGIPLGIAVLALYPGLLLLGYLTGALFLAQRAQAAARKEAPLAFSAQLGFVALALLILMLIGRLPVVGSLAAFLTTIAGLGACVLEWHRRRQEPTTAVANQT